MPGGIELNVVELTVDKLQLSLWTNWKQINQSSWIPLGYFKLRTRTWQGRMSDADSGRALDGCGCGVAPSKDHKAKISQGRRQGQRANGRE